MSTRSIFHLEPFFFDAKERVVLEHAGMTVSTFRYDSGVCAARLRNGKGELVMLPFQGQQIWSATFAGRDLTMKSMFDEPRATQDYLGNYGGFLLHCGVTAMGVPGDEDTHPLHGELPNAPFPRAHLVAGEDEKGAFIGLGGWYRHTVAFSCDYTAEPLVTLRRDRSVFDVSMTITNLRHVEMEWMYLAHVNFRPVDNGRLVYTAPCTAESVGVRRSVPPTLKTPPGFREFLDDLDAHPEKHNVLSPELPFDPEIVLYLDYVTDEAGWAHSMQVHPDGSADYIAHRPDQLGTGVRWICRTADQAALGIVLPATAEPEGYHAEKTKGNIKVLAPKGCVTFDMVAGAIETEGVPAMEEVIQGTLG